MNNLLEGFINIGNRQIGEFFVPRLFANEYQDPKFLRIGGYGCVIGLENVNRNRRGVAVKKFLTPFDRPKKAQRCFRELQLLRELDHENIVKMKFAYTTDESMNSLCNVYLTTEYCGVDLARLIAQETEEFHIFSLRSYQRMLSDLLRALKFLNSSHVIHRDLKPDNLAIDEDGKLTLLDFGIARVMDENNEMTRDPGNRFYRAIETIAFGENDRQVYNEKADMWSIGAILCEMLTGKILFEGKHPIFTALEICGPIPENVLEEIDDPRSQEALRQRSQRYTRIDFHQHFREKGRTWLRSNIEQEGSALSDFIDRTLAFDHRARMTVDEALAHPFLAAVRIPEKEVIASHSIPDVGDLSTEEWRRLIWEVIQASPVRFDEPLIR